MGELRESLDQAMRAVTVGDAPVDAAMRRGGTIRHRRRVTVLASALAVAVAAGVGYPAVTHLRAAPTPPVTPHRVVITDIPPGPGAKSGLVASGLIGDKSWRVTVDRPQQIGADTQQCFSAQGTAFPAQGTSQNCGSVLAPGTGPVEFTGSGDGPSQAQIGAVAADVTYVVVTLADGQQLKLIPVRVYGTRLVAFATPMSTGIASAVAYLDNGQYRTAIPADLPGGLPVFGAWLAPGEHGQARVTERVAAGTVDGHAWSVTAYVGPWGICVTMAPGAAGCNDTTAPATTTGVLGFAKSPPEVVYGSATAPVSYLVVTLTSGQGFRVPVVTVGDQKLFAFALAKSQTVRRWTAYDAAGHPLSSGGL
jgi:hypothetical protein